MQQYLEVGKVVTTHGVMGEVKLELWCDGPEFLAGFDTLFLGRGGAAPYKVLGVRPQKNMALVRLEGVCDMDAARALVGRVAYIDRAQAKLPKGRWFVQDILGCQVRDAATGQVYGTVADISRPGPHDVYTVKAPGGQEYRFPAVPEFLKGVCPDEGYVLVSPIPGMFGEAESGDEA